MDTPPSILVSGNTTLDIITVCNTPYNPSGKRAVAQYKQIPGGQAANVADLLASFGNKVSFVGAIGNDFAGKAVQNDFKRAGIEIGHSAFCKAPHHLGFVRVDEADGERFIDMYKDPRLTCDGLNLNENWIKGFDCIYIDNHEPQLAIRLGQLAQKHKIPVVADLEVINQHTDAILPYVDVLIAPAKIIQQLGNTTDTAQATRNVSETGFAAVVATMGPKGCLAVSGDNSVTVHGNRVTVADTTGAGDAFHGAFAHAMLTGYTLPDCLIAANDIAAKKCTFLGPRLPADIAKRLTPQRKSTSYLKERWLRNAIPTHGK